MTTQKFAVMFADVAGSSSLYKKIGDVRAKDAVFRCLALMKRITEANNGTLVKTIGDELMARFDSADDAICAARAIHQELHRGSVETTGNLAVKIGIHYGPAILEQNDIFGDAVNTAARMVSIANPQQIVITDDTAAALCPLYRPYVKSFDYVKIKAFDQDILLHLVTWIEYDDGPSVTMLAGSSASPSAAARSLLRVIYRGQEIVRSSEMPSFNLGRDETQCDLVVDSQLASRKHAWIEFRRGKFVLVDHSTNGTWVKTADDKEFYLRREELPLWGHGLLSLGEVLDSNTDHRIEFFC